MQKGLKIFRTVILILAALLVLLLIIIQTRPFKDLLRNIIVKKANETLYEAELSLDRIEGNYFNSITIKGIRLKQKERDVLTLKELSLQYSLRNLLQRKITFQQILLDELNLVLEQDTGKQWNLQTIFPQTVDRKEEQVKPFNWQIDIEKFTWQNSAASISTQEADSYIPSRISNLNISFRASYSEKESYLHLAKLSFYTNEPDFRIENITLSARMLDNLAFLDTLEIRTPQNLICSSAELEINTQEFHELSLNIEPLKLSEFQAFIPETDFKLLPDAKIRFKLNNQRAWLELRMEQDEQKLVLSLAADSVFSIPVYDLDLELAHIDGDNWLADEKLDSDINLQLKVSGKGIKPQQAQGKINLKISPSRLDKRTLDSMQFMANKTGNAADLSTQISGNFGKIIITGNVDNIFDQISFQLKGSLENCNLAPLLMNDSLASDINLSYIVTGKGTDPKTMIADILLDSEPSTIRDIELDKVLADIHYDNENYIIRIMELNNTLANLKLSGKGNLAGDHNLDFELVTGDLQPLKELIMADELNLEGNITGKVTSQGDDFNAIVELHLAQLKYNEYSSEKLEGTLAVGRQNNELSGDISLVLSELFNGNFYIHTLNLHSIGDKNRIQNVLDIVADSLNIHCAADVLPDSLITIELLALNAEYGVLLLETGHPDARILISKDYYLIENLELKNGDGLIKIAGKLVPEGTQDFSVIIENLALEQLYNSGLVTQSLQGRMDFNAQLAGTFKQPELKSDLNVRNAGWDKIILGYLEFSASLADNQLVTVYTLTRNDIEKISGSAKIPVYLDTLLSKEIIPGDEQIEVNLYIKDQDIGIMKASLAQVKKLEGLCNADMQLRNTLTDPVLSGNITLTQGKLSVPAWGINYPEIRLNASISNDNMELKEFYLKGGDGSFVFSGKVELEKPIQNGVKNIDLRALATKFTVADKRGLFILINSDISLTGSPDKLKYSGNLNIPKAVLDIDRLPGSKKAAVDINSPLLVRASQKIENISIKPGEKKKKTQSDVIKNISGELQINIPKNTWIRNKDMNIEIAGKLKIIKETRDFEIFGYVKTIRGKYEMYGRKFELQEGTLTFNGGAQPDPYLDLNARHMFRDINRDKRLLTLKVTGQAKNPVVEFFLDDVAISETDAISYILFGRSSSEISQGQKSEVSSQTESGMALGFLSKQIGNKIADQIGKTLNLDVVEFSGGANWKQASILVGKYITNDLFINYKKEFSLGQSKEIVPDEVSLEYEFKKHFSVQATRGNEKSTGIDFYWKFERK